MKEMTAKNETEAKREAALLYATALRDPERVARLLEGVDASALGKPRRVPVEAGNAA